MQRTDYRSETPLKAFLSVPVLLAVLSMAGFYFSINRPDQTIIVGNTTEETNLDTANVVEEAKSLKPYKLMKLGRLQEAVQAAQRLMESKPHDVAVIYCTAVVLNKSGSKDAAFTLMKKALALAPRNKDMRMDYARMLVDLGKYDEAVVQYHMVSEQVPRYANSRRELAQLFMNLDRPLDAAQELQQMLKFLPNDVAAHKMCGIALARAGKAQEGMDEYLNGILTEHGAGQPEAVKFILGAWGNMDKAKYELEQESIQHPDDPMPKLRLAEIALYADRPAEAKRYLTDARKLAPTNPEIHRSLCVALKRLGDNKQALNAFMLSVALEKEQSSKLRKTLVAPGT